MAVKKITTHTLQVRTDYNGICLFTNFRFNSVFLLLQILPFLFYEFQHLFISIPYCTISQFALLSLSVSIALFRFCSMYHREYINVSTFSYRYNWIYFIQQRLHLKGIFPTFYCYFPLATYKDFRDNLTAVTPQNPNYPREDVDGYSTVSVSDCKDTQLYLYSYVYAQSGNLLNTMLKRKLNCWSFYLTLP